MNWVTLYIRGRSGFKEEVNRRLFASDLQIMPGYETNVAAHGNEMYWIEENTPIRAIKEAIGSKLLWKYRLEFFCQPASPNLSADDRLVPLSDSEQRLVTSMRKKMKNVA